MSLFELPPSVETPLSLRDWDAAAAAIARSPRSVRGMHHMSILWAMVLIEGGKPLKGRRVASNTLLTNPECPMAHWVLGNAMQRLGKHENALHAYCTIRALITSASEPCCCVPQRGYARGLAADSHLHGMFAHQALRHMERSQQALEAHLGQRGPGCYSIYELGSLPRTSRDLHVYRPIL